MDKSTSLANEPVFALLIKLALPAIFAQIVVLGYNIVDRIYIGHLEDSHVALAALGISVPVTIILFSLTALFGRGGAPLSSISLGAKDIAHANHIISNCFSLLLIASLASLICVHIFAEDLLYALGGRAEVLQAGTEYLRIYNFGTPFIFIGLGLNYFINAQGYTKVAMFTPIIGGVANIFLNPIFIFWMDMGVAGAALATVISQALSCAWVIYFFLGQETLLHVKRDLLRPQWALTRKITILGSSQAFMISSEAVVLWGFNAQLFHYGSTLNVSSMAIVSSLFLLVVLPMIGTMQGAQPIISFNYGAKNLPRVKHAIFAALKINASYAFLMVSLILLFPQFFVQLFTNNANLIEEASRMLRIYICGGFFLAAMTTFQETYTALGRGGIAFSFAFLRKGILLVPLLFILPHFFEDKVFAIALAEPISDIFASVTNTLFFLFYAKRILKISNS